MGKIILYNDVKQIFSNCDCTLISKIYKNSKDLLEFICSCRDKNIKRRSLSSFKRGYICNCRGDSIKCRKCNLSKHSSNFYTYDFICKECKYLQHKKNINKNEHSYLKKLICSAKSNSKKRIKKSLEAGEISINIDDLLYLCEIQDKKCYYSNVCLSFKLSSNWQCSLERIDPNKGYITSNICLIASEFQGANQWSKFKFLEFIKLINIKHQNQNVEYENKICKITNPSLHKIQTFLINDDNFHNCKRCNINKSIREFNRNIGSGCKECLSKYHKLNYETFEGHFSKLFNHLKSRNLKKFNIETTIDLIALKDIFEKQNGLCAYSGIPMTFGSYIDKNWTCSVERKNIKKSYIIDNICLICYEFNTVTQWSMEKIIFIKNMCNYENNMIFQK